MTCLSETTRALVTSAGLDPARLTALVRSTLAEDLAWGPDVTTESTISADAQATASVVARAAGTLAGVPIAVATLEVLACDRSVAVTTKVSKHDGDQVEPGDVILTVTGPTRVLLTAERTLLNLLSQLSGVATLTAQWVDAVGGSGAAIRDTRKTVPGLRQLQKYAVRCGGGVNHRMGLGDAALIKDNHVAAAGSVRAAFAAVRRTAPQITVEVECDTLDQVREAIAAGAELILLDNFDHATMRQAVELGTATAVRFEASGGLTLDQAAGVAATGVDFLAVGALTHSAPVLDLAFDLTRIE
ncbi:MAG: carboxylating nicotinate-nucleotide diphosphorylase [Propionibacteriaceae bacterium]